MVSIVWNRERMASKKNINLVTPNWWPMTIIYHPCHGWTPTKIKPLLVVGKLPAVNPSIFKYPRRTSSYLLSLNHNLRVISLLSKVDIRSFAASSAHFRGLKNQCFTMNQRYPSITNLCYPHVFDLKLAILGGFLWPPLPEARRARPSRPPEPLGGTWAPWSSWYL